MSLNRFFTYKNVWWDIYPEQPRDPSLSGLYLLNASHATIQCDNPKHPCGHTASVENLVWDEAVFVWQAHQAGRVGGVDISAGR